jgi:hypothetical protein
MFAADNDGDVVTLEYATVRKHDIFGNDGNTIAQPHEYRSEELSWILKEVRDSIVKSGRTGTRLRTQTAAQAEERLQARIREENCSVLIDNEHTGVEVREKSTKPRRRNAKTIVSKTTLGDIRLNHHVMNQHTLVVDHGRDLLRYP